MNNKISIISPIFNCANNIEKSIQSVLNQTYKNIEYIIIDGGSTDGTTEIIKKYETYIAYWCSEKDTGIYDAMNKGISKSSGDWLYFLGSDDYLINSQVLYNISNYFNTEFKVVFGDVILPNKTVIKSKFSLNTLLNNTICHQGAFYSKELFINWRYNIKFKIMGDYELNLIIYLKKLKVKRVNMIIAFYSTNGISSKLLNEGFMETNKIRSKHINWLINFLLKVTYWTKFELFKLKHKAIQ